jgi:hypothetical protein
MIFRVYRPTEESRDFSPGFMMVPPSKSRSMTEACNVKWADLDEMEKELRAANIAVQAKAKKADGIRHPQMCGASTGTMNVYRINRSELEKARVLGFVLYIEGILIAGEAGSSASFSRDLGLSGPVKTMV